MTGETFETIEAMYDADPRRRHSRELDFGVHWREREIPWPRYRVSWIADTGEVYAFRQAQVRDTPNVVILGVLADEGRIETTLDNWWEHCGPPNGLQWVTSRLAAVGATA